MTNQDEELLARLLIHWDERAERGQEPSPNELAKDRPDLVDELARRIRALKATSWLSEPLEEDPPFGERGDPDYDPDSSTPSRPLGRRYRLDALVGEGGFAQVYRAYDLGLHRTVAVKIPKPSRNELAGTFLAEARRIAHLKHDNIVAVYDVGVEDKNVFIVSEFMEGESLAQRLAKGTLREEETISWITGIADALQYAHSRNVVHRDVKPANILVDHHGKAKLADFGIASLTGGSESSPNHFGTLNYMSPERVGGSEGDARSDIYGLAVVMYEALTGRPPPTSPARGRDWLTGVPKGLRRACEKALSHDPANRQQTAGEFAEDLRRVGRRRRATRAATWVASLCGVALAVGLLVAPGSRQALAMWWKSLKGDPVAHITVAGFGDRHILSGTLPIAWAKEGVLAEIKEPGIVEFEPLHESSFVLDMDVEVRNHRGRVVISVGEPNATTEVSLGRRVPPDELEPRIACRLVRSHAFGGRWFQDQLLPAGKRVTLQLVVVDDLKFLLCDGRVICDMTGDATDCHMRIVAERQLDATIYGLSVRPLTPDDARLVGCEFPVRDMACDVPQTVHRLADQADKSAGRAPVIGESYVLNDPWLAMKWIDGAEYVMGSPTQPLKQQGSGSERVSFSHGYWIGRYEVTQEQWESVMDSNPSRIKGSPYLPVNFVSWSDACEFCKRLTEHEREAGRCSEGYEYRLPTEAEWEYACRAADDTPVSETRISDLEQSQTHLKEVGSSPPNALGLYEMASVLPKDTSNVSEWCLDKWQEYPKARTEATRVRFHPGTPGIDQFVVRGGRDGREELYPNRHTRLLRDDVRGGFRGFRLVLGPEVKPSEAESTK